ncbi:MAG: UTP--glucose-1-phosphate uridylyltransferase, partial [Candidatus Micrarchaeia archaeon]
MIKPGHGNELQLTDALNLMCKEREVYAMLYNGKRYDIGNKLDWLKANIEIALKDQEFGGVLKDWLSKIF